MNSGNYAFSADWFSRHAEDWTKHLSHLAGRASLSFLEIATALGVSRRTAFRYLVEAPAS